MANTPLKLVYVTPALYMAGGVERVLTLKANYFAEHFGYDITIILTEGKGKPLFYPLSDKIHVINLDINFEELWTCSFVRKLFIYLKKLRRYRRLMRRELMRLRPDITVSLLRREINFITDIPDGSRKIGELHVNRSHYRNFEGGDANALKSLFAKWWMKDLVSHLRKLDRFIVLTQEDKAAWKELDNVQAIPNPQSFIPKAVSPLTEKRVLAVGRYTYQKGFDLLLQAWAIVEKKCPDWELSIYGDGDRSPYERQAQTLSLQRCHLNGSTSDIEKEYYNSSLFVLSSRFEGCAMVIVEALACGLPVVSFTCPCGPRDVIRDGIDGLLVEDGHVEQLAEKLIRLITDAQQRAAMSKSAQQRAQYYQMEYIAGMWKDLFESC